MRIIAMAVGTLLGAFMVKGALDAQIAVKQNGYRKEIAASERQRLWLLKSAPDWKM